MTEDEVVIRLEARVLKVALEPGTDTIGQGHGPTRPLRLWRSDLASHVAAAYPHPAGGPVHVTPPQREQLPLAETCHCGGQVESSIGVAKRAIGHAAEERLKLLAIEESDVRILRLDSGLLDGLDWIFACP